MRGQWALATGHVHSRLGTTLACYGPGVACRMGLPNCLSMEGKERRAGLSGKASWWELSGWSGCRLFLPWNGDMGEDVVPPHHPEKSVQGLD